MDDLRHRSLAVRSAPQGRHNAWKLVLLSDRRRLLLILHDSIARVILIIYFGKEKGCIGLSRNFDLRGGKYCDKLCRLAASLQPLPECPDLAGMVFAGGVDPAEAGSEKSGGLPEKDMAPLPCRRRDDDRLELCSGHYHNILAQGLSAYGAAADAVCLLFCRSAFEGEKDTAAEDRRELFFHLSAAYACCRYFNKYYESFSQRHICFGASCDRRVFDIRCCLGGRQDMRCLRSGKDIRAGNRKEGSMRIVVLDTAASVGGALSILKDFYAYLVSSQDGNEWIFLLSDQHVQETDHIKVHLLKKKKLNWLHRLWFDIYKGGKYINKLMPDAVLSLQNTLPRGIKGPKHLYIHQPIPFQTQKRFSFLKKEERIYAVYQFIIGHSIKKSVRRADCVVVQTEWLKKAIEDMNGGSGKVIKCMPVVEEQTFERGEYSHNYFIYPAAPIVYKNHRIIEEACRMLRGKGIENFRVDFTFEGEDENGIHYVGSLARTELFRRYTQGTLLFPSYIESFGYPLKEARGVGGFILAADCDFAHELLQGYENAYYFDPFSPEQLAALMEKVITGRICPRAAAPDETPCEAGWGMMVRSISGEKGL